MQLTAEALVEIAMTHPINAKITSHLPSLGLDQCMLTAGCLFQAVWNHQAAQHLFQGLGVNVEIKNQARVHLWYGQRFGKAYPELQSAKDGIDRYLIAGT